MAESKFPPPQSIFYDTKDGKLVRADKLDTARLNLLREGLIEEIRHGPNRTRPESYYAQIKREYGLQGKRPEVLVAFTRMFNLGGLAALGGLAGGAVSMHAATRELKRLGPKAVRHGITPALLREGMQVELEHRNVTHGRFDLTAKIAAAHLYERLDYYERLRAVEQGLHGSRPSLMQRALPRWS